MPGVGGLSSIKSSGAKYVAKFSSSTDLYNLVKAEYIAIRLAALVGIQAAPVKLVQAAQKEILLIECFDRERTAGDWTRKAMVSALTLFGLNDMMVRYASYETFELALQITRQFPALLCHKRSEYRAIVVNDLIEKGLLGPVMLATTSIHVPNGHPGRLMRHDPLPCNTVLLYSLSFSGKFLKPQPKYQPLQAC